VKTEIKEMSISDNVENKRSQKVEQRVKGKKNVKNCLIAGNGSLPDNGGHHQRCEVEAIEFR
jgi:hypothetical protein